MQYLGGLHGLLLELLRQGSRVTRNRLGCFKIWATLASLGRELTQPCPPPPALLPHLCSVVQVSSGVRCFSLLPKPKHCPGCTRRGCLAVPLLMSLHGDRGGGPGEESGRRRPMPPVWQLQHLPASRQSLWNDWVHTSGGKVA